MPREILMDFARQVSRKRNLVITFSSTFPAFFRPEIPKRALCTSPGHMCPPAAVRLPGAHPYKLGASCREVGEADGIGVAFFAGRGRLYMGLVILAAWEADADGGFLVF